MTTMNERIIVCNKCTTPFTLAGQRSRRLCPPCRYEHRKETRRASKRRSRARQKARNQPSEEFDNVVSKLYSCLPR